MIACFQWLFGSDSNVIFHLIAQLTLNCKRIEGGKDVLSYHEIHFQII